MSTALISRRIRRLLGGRLVLVWVKWRTAGTGRMVARDGAIYRRIWRMSRGDGSVNGIDGTHGTAWARRRFKPLWKYDYRAG